MANPTNPRVSTPLCLRGRMVYPLATFELGGRHYVRVLLPYTYSERLNARLGRSAHVQVVRRVKLAPGMGEEHEDG